MHSLAQFFCSAHVCNDVEFFSGCRKKFQHFSLALNFVFSQSTPPFELIVLIVWNEKNVGVSKSHYLTHMTVHCTSDDSPDSCSTWMIYRIVVLEMCHCSILLLPKSALSILTQGNNLVETSQQQLYSGFDLTKFSSPK